LIHTINQRAGLLAWLSRESSIKLNNFDSEGEIDCGQAVMIDFTKLLPKLLRAHGGDPELAVKLAWTRAAGVGLKPHAIPTRLEGRTLNIAVADAIWQRQLQHMSSELIFRINNVLGQAIVESLNFRVDPATVAKARGSINKRKEKDEQRAAAPSELLFAAGSIADEDLRARFIRAAENCIARRDAHDEP
jgi:hypothetical protein